MSRPLQVRRLFRGGRAISRALAAAIGGAALFCGAHAGADVGKEEWFCSPVSGQRYVVERDAELRTKTLVAPDGRRFPSVAAVVESETLAQTPLERLLAPDLLAVTADPARADELVDVTFLFRRQPAYEAGVAARGRADPALSAEFARQRPILDRIAPLRTLPGGKPPDIATAMKDEAVLLTVEEKATLREVRDRVLAIMATLRREVMAEATPAVREDQRPLAEFVAGLPGALDFGGSVTLNARSARVPARALLDIAERFPEVLRVESMSCGVGCCDTAVPAVGAATWWNANYNGNSNTKIGLIDNGVDASHPALSSVVSASAVYHTAAAGQGSAYGESTPPSTDDLQGHGTAVAGILCSTDSTYTGIAPGGLILNAKAAYYNTAGTANMVFSDGRLAADWAINQSATSLLLNYGGGGANNGTSEMELFFDAAAFSVGVSGVVASKNLGPNSSTVGYPGGVFNALTCGCTDDNSTTALSDDFIFTASGRGPTSDGRQKPDICAPGVNITTAAYDWEGGTSGSNPDFTSFTPGTNNSGTSTVGPLIAGAICLLQDASAAAYPAGLKALLLTTTFGSTLQSSGSSSTYAAPDNNIGYGVLDCGPAYTYRGSVYEGQLTSSGPRFVLLRGGALATGKRATLVWSRHVAYSGGTTIPSTYYAIQDLDFYVYNESTGSQVAYSASTLDPNEQVAVTSAVSSPIYKVYRVASTFTSNYTSEPFAVAAEATSSTTLIASPTPVCTFTQFADAVAGSSDTTVTVQVANTGGVKAFAPSVTLTLPTGYTITTGANPRTLSDIAAQSTSSATWVVHSHSGPSGAGTISASATTTSYGEQLTSSTLSRTQMVDVDPPTGTVAIAGAAPYTTTRDVTVTLTASDTHTSVTQMRVRNAGDAWGAWTAYATSVNTTLPVGEGTKTFEAQFADAVGNVSSTFTDTIVYDVSPPSGALAVNAGAGFVNTASVTLTNNASDALSGVDSARYSNDGLNWGTWTNYTTTAAWSLTAGDGTRTVYAQYRDGAGNVSATTNDAIVVETVAPIGTVSIAGGAAWTTFRDVTLNLSATDAVSGVQDVRVSDNGTVWNDWRLYAANLPWSLPAGDGTKSVFVQFRDRAGNVSSTASDFIGVDTGAPIGTVKIAGDTPYTSITTVTLDLSATDALNGVAQMRLSGDFVNWSAWMPYATTYDWTLGDGDGMKFAYAQFKDGVGNTSSTASDTITLDTVAPIAGVVIEGDATAIDSTTVSLDLSWFDGGSGVSQARMSNDGTTWSAWTSAQETLPWTTDPGEGAHTVFVQLRDRAGNASAISSDSIFVDLTAPTGSFVLVQDAAYVMPWTTLSADTTAGDGPTGSGVAAFRSTTDGGATWSEWSSIPPNGRMPVLRPAAGDDKLVTAQGEFRDVAGNVSIAAFDAAYLVAGAAPSVTQIASFLGTVGPEGDIDAVRMGLVAGDKLSLKLKAKTLVKKADAHVDIDIYGPDHVQLVTGRHPSTQKTPGVTKFEAPATGEYWIVLRAAGTAADSGVSYTLLVSDLAAKGSRAKKGTAEVDAGAQPPGVAVAFDAVEDMKLSGKLTVPLLDTTTVPTLTAPDGSTVPITVVRGKKGLIKLLVPKLVGGAGTYTLSIPASGPVKYSFALSPPKRGKLDETTLQ